jgi:Spy/CpxP family protein refolding chaperone
MIRTWRQRFILLVLGGALVAPLGAQSGDSGAAPGAGASQFRQRMAQMVKRQLGLTDSQLVLLGAVNQKYEQKRFLLLQQERELRITIRAEVLRGDQADQKLIAKLLDQMIAVQQQRLQILQSEQKDLSAFLTPSQRAQYLGIQEQVRKRLANMQGNGQGRGQRGQPPPQGAPPQ